MRNPKENDLAGRRKSAAEAKAARLQAHRSAQETAEPKRLARQEKRISAAAAKEERIADRERAKLEEQERVVAQAALDVKAASAAAEGTLQTREESPEDRPSRTAESEAAQKAERDRRYADRKARQK